jgi:hypothetical protein
MTPTTTFETKTPFDTKLACATPNESSDLFVRGALRTGGETILA